MAAKQYNEKKIQAGFFRAYDIRGVIDDEFNEDAFYTIGRAVSAKLHALNRCDIVVAYDGRLTSPALSQALMAGLVDSGIKVLNLGAVPTPLMYYAVHTQGIDSGLMVTGSHNPATYNGIKLVIAGKTLVQEDMTALYECIQKQAFVNGQGLINNLSIEEEYKHKVLSSVKLARPLKVVVDCGNGIAGNIAPAVLSALGLEVIPLYCEVDGRFPNHHPDPTEAHNVADLIKTVLETKADVGLAFDGDGDRLGLITNKGEIIWPDRLIIFYLRDILKRFPGKPIVFDVKCSTLVAKEIEKAGGIPIICPTGHSIVKALMKEKGAVLAGEMSGHLFFNDNWYGFDDALFSACRLVELMSQSPLSLSEQFDNIPNSINTPEIKIPLEESKKFAFMQKFLAEASFEDASVIKIDGLRAEFEHGFGLLRASNTTPCLVARFEAKDEKGLEQIKNRFKSVLLKIDATVELPF